MKSFTMVNLLFTITFIVLLTPLCILLLTYILNHGFSTVAAKEPLSKFNISPITTNRDFSDLEKAADSVTVLMYHQIIPENMLLEHHFTDLNTLNDSIVTLEQFTDHMTYLKENNYTVLSLKEFEEFMTAQKKVPINSVLITFDDGYKNVFEFAYPVLKKYDFPAVQFLITGLITNRRVPYTSTDLQYASIDELKAAADIFDYGNHTHSYHQKNDEEVAFLISKDIRKVKNDLLTANEWLGRSVAFAAPYGEYTPATLDVLRDLEISMAFTIQQGYAEPANHILEIPRQGIYPSYTMEDFKRIVEQNIE